MIKWQTNENTPVPEIKPGTFYTTTINHYTKKHLLLNSTQSWWENEMNIIE